MSAGNWRVCPNCKVYAEAEANAKRFTAAEAYGKVEPQEYLKMLADADSGVKLDETLREDYEIGTYDGVFSVDYSCCCQKCGLHFRYKHEQKLKLKSMIGVL